MERSNDFTSCGHKCACVKIAKILVENCKKAEFFFERRTSDYMHINGLKVGEEGVDASLNHLSCLELRAQGESWEGKKIPGTKLCRSPILRLWYRFIWAPSREDIVVMYTLVIYSSKLSIDRTAKLWESNQSLIKSWIKYNNLGEWSIWTKSPNIAKDKIQNRK